MALTITATVASASANSFVTEAEAIAYAASRPNASAWTTVSGATCTEAEKAVLIEATRELSHLLWRGSRASETQALAWPREWVVNPDSPNGFYYDADVIPQRVKDATAELAIEYLKAGTTDLSALDPKLGILSEQVDVIRVDYAPHLRPAGLRRFPSVFRFIAALLAGAGGAAFRVERG